MFSFPNQPLIGSDLKNFWTILKDNDYQVNTKYLARSCYVGLLNHTFTSFFSKIEKYLYAEKIAEVRITEPPIFIIGHWRSGTTLLHYLMSKDTQLGFVNNAQSFFPNYMFHNNNPIINSLIGLHLPKKRPMDNVLMDMDLPQEEEFALGNISNQSCYHWWTFPNRMKEYFEKYVLLQNLDIDEYHKFQQTYLRLLKKIQLINKSKRLLIKNPANTGRIPFLLELFPNAQFIYLERDPIEVYHSTVKLHTKLMERFAFQSFDKKEIEQNTIQFHNQLFHKYEVDKQLIPTKNLIELDYQSLIKNPLKTTAFVYETLQIKGFQKAFPAFQNFVDSQQNYQTDIYTINPILEAKLRRNLTTTPVI